MLENTYTIKEAIDHAIYAMRQCVTHQTCLLLPDAINVLRVIMTKWEPRRMECGCLISVNVQFTGIQFCPWHTKGEAMKTVDEKTKQEYEDFNKYLEAKSGGQKQEKPEESAPKTDPSKGDTKP